GQNQCLQGFGNLCQTCSGVCEPRNDGFQGCGGPPACVGNTQACTRPNGVHECCSCNPCGGICCAGDHICSKDKNGAETCSPSFSCKSGVGCYNQCCAKGETCDSASFSCQAAPSSGPLCKGGKKVCVDPTNGSVTCCGVGQVCAISPAGSFRCRNPKAPCNGKLCTSSNVRGDEVTICCGKGTQCAQDPFGDPLC